MHSVPKQTNGRYWVQDKTVTEDDCMRRAKRSGSFILCLLFNMLMNLEGLIPAAVLLILHFLFDWSIWWSVLAAALWIVLIILWMLFIGWSGRCGSTPDTPKENKNPYSVGNKKDLKTERTQAKPDSRILRTWYIEPE